MSDAARGLRELPRRPVPDFACTVGDRFDDRHLRLFVDGAHVGYKADGDAMIGYVKGASLAYLTIERQGIVAELTTPIAELAVGAWVQDGVVQTDSAVITNVFGRDALESRGLLPRGFLAPAPTAVLACRDISTTRGAFAIPAGREGSLRAGRAPFAFRRYEDGDVEAVLSSKAHVYKASVMERGKRRSKVAVSSTQIEGAASPHAMFVGWVDNRDLEYDRGMDTGLIGGDLCGGQGGMDERLVHYTCSQDVALMVQTDRRQLRLGTIKRGATIRVQAVDDDVAELGIVRLGAEQSRIVASRHRVGVRRSTLDKVCTRAADSPLGSAVPRIAVAPKRCR